MADGSDGDTRALRRAFGAFATGVTVVTTLDPDGRRVGLTANSFTSVSLDPPLVLVCIAENSASHAAFRQAERFAVSILNVDQRRIAEVFATRGADKFAVAPWSTRATGAPVLDGAAAWFDCTRHQVVPAGDHIVLIGQVAAFERDPEARPLCWCSGRFAALDGGAQLAAVVRRGRDLLVRDAPGGLALPRSTVWGPAADPSSLLGRIAGVCAPDAAPIAVWSCDEAESHVVYHVVEAMFDAAPAGEWRFAPAEAPAMASAADAAAVARILAAA